MFCPSCGSQLADGSAFCPSCGTPLPGPAPASTQPGSAPVPPVGAYAQQPGSGSYQQPGAYRQPGAYQQPAAYGQTVVNVAAPQSNGMGTAGFVLALIGLFFSWVPLVGQAVWLVGLILSLVGLGREPRGLAIAGTIISLIGLILFIGLMGCVGIAALGTL